MTKTPTEPRLNPRTGEFVGVDTEADPKPGPEDAGFLLKLSLNGNAVGYVGLDVTGWCYISDQGPRWSSVPGTNGFDYYFIVSGGAPYDGRYLSVSNGADVGVYTSGSAVGWKIAPNGIMTNNFNNQNLSAWSVTFNGALYAWNAYQVLTVEIEP